MAESERKKPSRKVFISVSKSKHRDMIRYRHKTVSDDEESLVKNADLDQQQDAGEMDLQELPFHRLETLGSQDELGPKESRNYAKKCTKISSSSKVEHITDDGELKANESAVKISAIELLEPNQQCPELIIKNFSDVTISSDENEHGVNSGKTEVCYLQENPDEKATVGRIKPSQTESSITTHDQRSSDSQSIPISAEFATKTKRSNKFADKSDSRQSENGRQVKTAKRISKKRWKKGKKSKKMDASRETLPISISGDRDSETIEILEMDEDHRKQTKRERRKKRRKRAKKMAKTAGVTVWKGIREGWKLMWSGLAMYTLPLGSLDVSTNIAKVWSTKTAQYNH